RQPAEKQRGQDPAPRAARRSQPGPRLSVTVGSMRRASAGRPWNPLTGASLAEGSFPPVFEDVGVAAKQVPQWFLLVFGNPVVAEADVVAGDTRHYGIQVDVQVLGKQHVQYPALARFARPFKRPYQHGSRRRDIAEFGRMGFTAAAHQHGDLDLHARGAQAFG